MSAEPNIMGLSQPESVSTDRAESSASWRAFMAAYLGWVFDYFEVYFLTIVIVPMAKEFGWTNGQISVILSTQLASLAVGGVL